MIRALRTASHIEQLKSLLALPFDRAAWNDFTSEHLHVRIGNGPVSIERATSLAQIETFFGRILGFGCGFCEAWQRRDTVFAETEVQFLAAGGAGRVIPCVLIARVVRDKLVDLRFYLDASPIP